MIRIRHHDAPPNEVNEINVTPFIDVILVLLIIFMVTAPLTTVNIPVDLPSSTEKAVPQPQKPVFLTIKSDHSLSLGDAPIQKEQLAQALIAQTNGNKKQQIFLRADKTVNYDQLIQTMDTLRSAGYFKVGLVGLQGEGNLK